MGVLNLRYCYTFAVHTLKFSVSNMCFIFFSWGRHCIWHTPFLSCRFAIGARDAGLFLHSSGCSAYFAAYSSAGLQVILCIPWCAVLPIALCRSYHCFWAPACLFCYPLLRFISLGLFLCFRFAFLKLFRLLLFLAAFSVPTILPDGWFGACCYSASSSVRLFCICIGCVIFPDTVNSTSGSHFFCLALRF